MRIPSYTPRLVAETAVVDEKPGAYKSVTNYGPNARQDARTPYIPAKTSLILPRGYSGPRSLFRYSRRRPRKLSTQKSSCSYCGGSPNSRPVFATPAVAGKMGEVKKNLAPHCANCGVSVA
ncbi:MAG: hypothetical protein HYS53_01950 [Candidatus Aenigmarchaeota archaeon]|nr:hypothetical protein [Candidatus Aenigmarchaeota archaeon]